MQKRYYFDNETYIDINICDSDILHVKYMCRDVIYGYISGVITYKNQHILRNKKIYGNDIAINILDFRVNDKFIGFGIGTKLLTNLIDYAKKIRANKIILDDMSNNYRKYDKNIYLKNGFRYINNDGPEMELLIKKIENITV